MNGKYLLSLTMALAFTTACPGEETTGGDCTTDGCPAPKVCDTKLKICKNPTTNQDGGGGGTDDGGMTTAEWPKPGVNFTSKFYHVDNADTDVNFTGALTVDKTNAAILGGGFKGTLDASTGVKAGNSGTSAGDRDIFLAKYDTGLNFVWQKSYGGAGPDFITSVATDSQGAIYAAGFVGTGTVLAGTTASAPSIFVAKFDGSNGAIGWAKLLGIPARLDPVTNKNVPTYDIKPQVASDGTNVYLLSAYGGTIDLGGGFLDGTGTMPLVAAALTGAGAHIWSKKLGDFTNGVFLSLAADATGPILAGDLKGGAMLNLGNGALSVVPDGMFIGRMSAAAGAGSWSNKFPSAEVRGLNVDAAGTAIAVGRLPLEVSFGALKLTPMVNTFNNGFLVRFGKDGTVGVGRAFQSVQSSIIRGVGVAQDSSNDYAITGDFRQEVNFGGMKRTGFSNSALVARYTSDGSWVNDNFLSSSLGQSAGDNIAGGPDGSYTLLLSIKKDAVATTVKQLGLYRVIVKAQ